MIAGLEDGEVVEGSAKIVGTRCGGIIGREEGTVGVKVDRSGAEGGWRPGGVGDGGGGDGSAIFQDG